VVGRDLWVGIRILKDKGLANREIQGKKYWVVGGERGNQELQLMAPKKKKNFTWVAFEINPFCRQDFVKGSVLEKF